jgi:hypothetical protein
VEQQSFNPACKGYKMNDREIMQMALEEIEELVKCGYSGNIIVVQALRDRLERYDNFGNSEQLINEGKN